MIRHDCRLSAKPSALSRYRYFVSHCVPSDYKKVVSADTPNPCTQPTRHSCNNLIFNILQNPGVGRHHTNLHSADIVTPPFVSPSVTSLVSPASIEDLPRSFLVLLGLTGDLLRSPSLVVPDLIGGLLRSHSLVVPDSIGDLLRSPSRLSKLYRESPQVSPPLSSLTRSGASFGRPPSSSPPRSGVSFGRPPSSSQTRLGIFYPLHVILSLAKDL